MPAYEIGYDIGFETEKIAEIVITEGAYNVVGNASKLAPQFKWLRGEGGKINGLLFRKARDMELDLVLIFTNYQTQATLEKPVL